MMMLMMVMTEDDDDDGDEDKWQLTTDNHDDDDCGVVVMMMMTIMSWFLLMYMYNTMYMRKLANWTHMSTNSVDGSCCGDDDGAIKPMSIIILFIFMMMVNDLNQYDYDGH